MPKQIVTSDLGTFGEDQNSGAGKAGGDVEPLTSTPEEAAAAAAEREQVDTTLANAIKGTVAPDAIQPDATQGEHVATATPGETQPPAPSAEKPSPEPTAPTPEETPKPEAEPETPEATTWGAVNTKEIKPEKPPPPVEEKKYGGFATFEEYQADVNRRLTASQTEAVRLYKQLQTQGGTPPPSDQKPTLPPDEQAKLEQDAFKQLCASHADILDAATANDYQKFVESGNNVFVFNSPKLYAIAKAMERVSDHLPMTDRLEAAFQLAFGNDIANLRAKQAQATAEIAATNAAKAGMIVPKGGGPPKPKYTEANVKWAETMGVELP